MVEIFTVGGGEYIVNVLNAVAAWTGAGGYKSLIQVTMVMGLALAVIVLAACASSARSSCRSAANWRKRTTPFTRASRFTMG